MGGNAGGGSDFYLSAASDVGAAKENENATQLFKVYMIIATRCLHQGALAARSNSDPAPSNDGTTRQLDVVHDGLCLLSLMEVEDSSKSAHGGGG